jgi:hypothetical protein
MKIKYFFLSALLIVVFSSCFKDKCTDTYTFTLATPVYIDKADFRKEVQFQAPRKMEAPGKIYIYGNTLLVNEQFHGIHVIDNSNPKNPIKMGFLDIVGNVDMSIRGNVLYADAYTDLIAVDLSNINSPTVIDRHEDVFLTPYQIHDGGIIGYYNLKDTTVTEICNKSHGFWGDAIAFESFRNQSGGTRANFDASSFGSGGPATTGQAGSMARFSIVNNHLYAIENRSIYAYEIQGSGRVSKSSEVVVGFGIETLFPFKNYLFVGANDGMHIMDIDNPGHPVKRSTFSHARACDPVIVDQDIAYVTLRSGTNCFGGQNTLEVIDVKDVNNPVQLFTHPMQNPHGLSKFEDNLFICEGVHGLKVFDAKVSSSIPSKLKDHHKNIHAYDVIALSNNHIIVVGDDGLYQYEFSDSNKLVQLSSIKTKL